MLVGANQTDQASLQTSVRSALARFIPKCTWVFSVLERGTHTVAGYERINLKAAARVASTQNYNLYRRAQLASIEGLSISDPVVDYDLPTSVVDKAVADLRVKILRQVMDEAVQFKFETGRNWRIGKISYGNYDDYSSTVKGATRQSGSEILDVDDLVDGLSGSQQIGITATVVLRTDDKWRDSKYPDVLECKVQGFYSQRSTLCSKSET